MKKSIALAATAVAVFSLGIEVQAQAAPNDRQSPINIQPSKVVRDRKAPPINVSLSPDATVEVFNTYDPTGSIGKEWSTLRVNVPAGSTAVMNGEVYNLLQFHFHTPSQHTVNGKHQPLEMHMVFLKEGAKPCDRRPDALLVIGTEIVAGKGTPELAKIFDQAILPNDKTGAHITIDHFNVAALLPKVGPSWRYSGSLTAPATFTPTCDEAEGNIDDQLANDRFPENVQWVVLQKKLSATPDEIAMFRRIFPQGNARPVEPLNGRKVIAAA